MGKLNKVILSFFTTAVAALPIHAQDAGQPLPVEERVARIEKIVSALPRISGFVNIRYQFNEWDKDNTGFDIRRARLDVQGDISKKFDYRLQVEFAGSAKILDAYFRWKIDKRLNVQAGEFKIPFSLENIYGPHQLETIDNSLSITALSGYSDVSGISANGRDVGLSLYGGFLPKDGYNIIDYAVGIFNGNGINTIDNNKNKDFSGRISINPIKQLTLSISHYNGSTGAKTPDGDRPRERVRTAVGAKYDTGRLLVRGEYLEGKTGDIRNLATSTTFKSRGAYGVAAYYVHPMVQPLVKVDYFDRDKSTSDGRQIYYTAGVNVFPVKKYVRLQLNYTYRTFKGSNDVNYVAAQIFGLF